MALRQNDGSTSPANYKAPLGANWWVPTPPAFAPPLLPQWPYVTPWTMTSGSQFRSPGPPILTDPRYVLAFNEVKDLGRFDSTMRTPDQSQIAKFWDDGAGTQTPPGHWNEIAQLLAAQQGNSLLENARLFALLNLTVADAAIVSWDNKYFYGHWRPYTGIVMADVDGNPATQRDTGWGSFITTPPFPSYTSGHSTFSGSSGRLLARFFDTDDLAFTAGSDGTPGVMRSFESLSQAAEEAGQSRIYGGIHWQYENRDGLASGRALADFVFFNFLRPLAQTGPQTCAPSGSRLCLGGGRFAAEVDWRTQPANDDAATGIGFATPITRDSGGFWFFDEDNTEIIVKVLDACDTENRFWVFAGGATNVEYVLRVTDTRSGETRTYYNPLDHMAGAVLDSEAFATCP
ncbi:MAG: vanadium-dependent haloperoxidase [Thermoanaerobaculia bacterium]|nr:vanadium-dependent haloperoxidase [Thermoanaerobaculia bacterium]